MTPYNFDAIKIPKIVDAKLVLYTSLYVSYPRPKMQYTFRYILDILVLISLKGLLASRYTHVHYFVWIAHGIFI